MRTVISSGGIAVVSSLLAACSGAPEMSSEEPGRAPQEVIVDASGVNGSLRITRVDGLIDVSGTIPEGKAAPASLTADGANLAALYADIIGTAAPEHLVDLDDELRVALAADISAAATELPASEVSEVNGPTPYGSAGYSLSAKEFTDQHCKDYEYDYCFTNVGGDYETWSPRRLQVWGSLVHAFSGDVSLRVSWSVAGGWEDGGTVRVTEGNTKFKKWVQFPGIIQRWGYTEVWNAENNGYHLFMWGKKWADFGD